MKLIKIIYLFANFIASDNEKRVFIIFGDSDNRSTFESKYLQFEALLDNRSFGGGEITSKLPLIDGIGGSFSPEALRALEFNPLVGDIIPITEKYAEMEQMNSTWGLSRISNKDPVRKEPYSYKYKEYPNGKGIIVYVIDTGVNISHEEFEGRASFGTSTVENSSQDDKHGHGTHCAGTVAGKTYGIAKQAEIIAVKVLGDNGKGDDESVIKGVQWSIEDANSKGKNAVLSMSLGGPKNKALDDAVNNAYEKGVIIVAAAGNNNIDSCEHSPGSASSSITVGSIDKENKKSPFSNYGKCVKILAPGSKVTSAWIGSESMIKTISGTSMATPHVAGQVAILWSEIDDRDKVVNKLYKMALKNQTTGWDENTPDLLLYNGQY